jgi:hypothetical protein
VKRREPTKIGVSVDGVDCGSFHYSGESFGHEPLDAAFAIGAVRERLIGHEAVIIENQGQDCEGHIFLRLATRDRKSVAPVNEETAAQREPTKTKYVALEIDGILDDMFFCMPESASTREVFEMARMRPQAQNLLKSGFDLDVVEYRPNMLRLRSKRRIGPGA